MRAIGENETTSPQRGVYPPSFCRWRLLLAVIAVTQVSVLLISIGKLEHITLAWLGVTSLYAQALALITAGGVCVSKAWLDRLSARGAWLGSWLVALVAALAFSYAAGIVGTVLGVGPGRANFDWFVTQSVLAVALVSAPMFRYLYVRAQSQLQLLAQSEARVQALQARIRPHFLFNSLNTIASLIPDDPRGAERATEDLADLFRGSMRRSDDPIRLAEELELAKKYLHMEQRRIGERLRVDLQLDELPPDALILPLTLQPLLENAVVHGIQPLVDGGEIRVYGRIESDKVVITICNPFGPDGQVSAGHGMALTNIRERLKLVFGTTASLITHQDAEQFFAVLSLPYVESTDS